MPRLGERLSVARRQRFCGRATELALFESVLTSPELPFHVLYVYGPHGIGKSTLLLQFIDFCAQAAIPVYFLDARTIEPKPEVFLATLAQVTGGASSLDLDQTLLATSQRQILLIDTYEQCTPLDGWFRNTFLPTVPENTLVVLADCDPPALAWRTDPGWQMLLQTMPLRNFSPAESRSYLTMRNVPTEQQAAILSFTHGHPLALALVSDLFAQRQILEFKPEEAPDIVTMLLEHLVQRVPGQAHRAALEACALVRITTESLLSEMLRMPDVHELFAWLHGLSFIVASREGLVPHALVREALAANVRWRNPDWYMELHRRARAYYANRLQQVPLHEQQRVLMDYIFLHRANPMVRPFFEWPHHTTMMADGLRDTDRNILVAMVEQFEGTTSAAHARYWLTHYPQFTLVMRTSSDEPAGFLMLLQLHAIDPSEREADPATRAAWNYLAAHAPLRGDEQVTLFRFWMVRDTYQAVSPEQSLIFVHMVRHYLTTPGLAFTFLPCVEPDFWSDMFHYADLARLPEADFTIGEQAYGMYGHDWRTVPSTVWLERLATREVATDTTAAPLDETPIVVLSYTDFVAAVRDALRDIANTEALRTSPLLRARFIVEQAGFNTGQSERVALLQSLLREACEQLRASPQTLKFYRALYHTYLQPAATQEQAAEVLDVPFSTYRRHLKAGVTHLADLLWQHEMGGQPV